nr:MAG TPA: hypothetical protein [Caudoviricetes sp.]
MRDGLLDYTGTTALSLRSAGIPGVVALEIHTPATSTSALMDSYALGELRNIIQKALERTNNK